MFMLDLNKTKKMLGRYRIPFCRGVIAGNIKKAVDAAKSIGWPVVLKIVSPDIIHKSDVGGVKTGISNEKELSAAYGEIIKTVKRKMPKARITGVLVQQMCSGEEVIIGVKRDEQFGAVIMFGLGGVFVEVLKDVSLRIAPVDKSMAEEMIKEIKGYLLLSGIRGKKAVNINAIIGMIINVSRMIMANKKIIELDFNPVMVDERKAVVADARIILQ